MGCFSLANFVVLVNGQPTYFLKISRGLRQVCPLSPLLFLFILEGLSRLIYKAKREGNLQGVELSLVLKIAHLPFVDDVLLFGEGTMEEFKTYKSFLDWFLGLQVWLLVIVNLISQSLDCMRILYCM